MVCNKNPEAKFCSHFGNNIKIRPVRPMEIKDGTTPRGDLSYDTFFAKIRPALSEISGQNSKEERERKE